MSDEVKAAGGVPVRDGLVVVVHRPKYDDWTLPKGKLDPGESFEEAAIREVEEETSLRCRLGPELSPTRYRDNKDRPKIVRWWAMEIAEEVPFEPNDEVDQLRWLEPDGAAAKLSYERDRSLVGEAVSALSDAG
ncbi:MAG TPA: NUDIX hydrolase [Thermoleophilaceae bacterium]|nr:NUDIX hydrolase [Thermoleophilaceae bacterium]